MKKSFTKSVLGGCTLLLLAAVSPVAAHEGGLWDRLGNRTDGRLDRRGERINDRLDHRGELRNGRLEGAGSGSMSGSTTERKERRSTAEKTWLSDSTAGTIGLKIDWTFAAIG